MLSFWPCVAASAAIVIWATPVAAQEKVEFASADGTKLAAYQFKPAGNGPFPAVIAMHGCGGLWDEKTGKMHVRHANWGNTFTEAGFVALFVDSLVPRNLKTVCSPKDGELRGPTRAQDAFGASGWLAAQTYVDKTKIGLVGWSHGGGAALAAATLSTRPPNELATVVAFYAPCQPYLQANVKPKVKLTMLHGAADDWTPVGPCEALAKANNVEFVSYPKAFHNFDWPAQPVFKVQGVGPAGVATIGTNEEARKAAIAKTLAVLKAM